jgi:hypothetical protein
MVGGAQHCHDGDGVGGSRDRNALAQAAYYLVTGIWPLIHIESFERVTGRKVDRWLVKTSGGLLTTAGVALGVSAMRGKTSLELDILAIGTAATLATIDIIYVFRRRIRPVYLLDAGINLTLLAGVVVAHRQGSSNACAR